jgi:hypothetical protein
MRVLIAGILGAIAMFVWMSIAHIATPLATTGFSQIPNEGPVLSAMRNSMGNTQGLYFYPWTDMKGPKAMEKQAEVFKTKPHGILIYNPPGSPGMMPSMMFEEFVKEAVLSLIAAFLLMQTALAGYAARVGFVSLVGLAGALTTNPSYMIWYGFPANYTLSYGFIDFFGFVVAGLVIAAIVRPKSA